MPAPHFERLLDAIHQICRFTVAGIWFYQGLVPKLLGPHGDELAMGLAFGLSPHMAQWASYGAGSAEIAFALCLVVFHRQAWPQLISAIAMVGLLAFVVLYAPAYLLAAFNPAVMNVAGCALSVIGVLVIRARKAQVAGAY